MTIPQTNIAELDRLDWHEKTVKKGERSFTFLTAAANEGFWKLRDMHKNELDEAGIKPSQFNGVWSVNWWKNNGAYQIPVLVHAGVEPPPEVVPLVNEKNYKPFQIPLAQQVVASMKKYQVSLNGCGTGVGKTFITLGGAREFGMKLVVICPKTIVSDWKRAGHIMGVEVDPHGWEWVKTGKTQWGHWKMREVKTKKSTKMVKDSFVWTIPEGHALVFDECHRASGIDTQNAHIVIQAKHQAIPMFLLSATIANDPTRMRAPGYALGIHKDGTDFYAWMQRNGVKQVQFMVNGRMISTWKFYGGVRQLQAVHRSIFPHKGCRVTAEQLGDQFPKTQIIAKAYDMDEAKDIQEAYNEMQARVNEIMESKGENKQANILVEILRARQRVELLKVPLFCSLTSDALEEGNSVFIAVNFKDTLRELEEQLKIKSVIIGGQKPTDRQDAIDDFQSNKNKIIIGIMQACREGISLHDVIGGHPRLALIMPTQSAFDLKQVLGRVHRVDGKTPSIQRIVFAAGTIEEQVVEGLATKLDSLEVIMDGDLSAGIFPAKYSDLREEE